MIKFFSSRIAPPTIASLYELSLIVCVKMREFVWSITADPSRSRRQLLPLIACTHLKSDRFPQMPQLARTCTNDISSAISDDVTSSCSTRLCHETTICVDFDHVTHWPLSFLHRPSGVYSREILKFCSILLDHIYEVINWSHLLSFPYSISFRPPLPKHNYYFQPFPFLQLQYPNNHHKTSFSAQHSYLDWKSGNCERWVLWWWNSPHISW